MLRRSCPVHTGCAVYLFMCMQEGVCSQHACNTVGTAMAGKISIACAAGHPEFSKEFMDELITWRSDTAPEALPPALKEEACMQLSEQPVTKQDVLAMQRLCRAFLTA